ncbi:MAG: amino acid aminotransferase [Vibrionaceae bacterium]
MFEKIDLAPADPILGLSEEFNRDPRLHKINLSVGIYKDELGNTPILQSVQQAEQQLLEKQNSKTYLNIEGSADYAQAVQKLLFSEHFQHLSEQICTAHTPGGTGALRVAAEFIKRNIGDVTVWVSDPTWANHLAIFAAAGLKTQTYPYRAAQNGTLDVDAICEQLALAKAGDVLLLHGCCHNPTGIDPTLSQWQKLAHFCLKRELLPFFDFAYQGFAHGVELDATPLQLFVAHSPELLVASSFSKNFGLYNERVGALTLLGAQPQAARHAFSQIKAIVRTLYSNPPAQGAAIVTTILNDAKLYPLWLEEVTQMRARIQKMRTLFVKTLREFGVQQDFSFIEQQCGMFSFSGLTSAQVAALKNEHAIYIVGSGRISVAGMTEQNIPIICQAIAQVLNQSKN